MIWVARESMRSSGAVEVGKIRLMALHAFYSARSGTLGFAIHAERWSSRLKPKEALRRAEDWLTAVEVTAMLGPGQVDPFCEPGHADGFEFVPIVTGAALIEEAKAMENCLRLYGGGIASDAERVWSIRRDGVRVAALCVEFGEAPFPRISELKGPRNKPAPDAVWFAARRWLDGQAKIDKPKVDWDRPLDRIAWTAIWKPYWLARSGSLSSVPLAPSQDALWDLRGASRRRRRRRRN